MAKADSETRTARSTGRKSATQETPSDTSPESQEAAPESTETYSTTVRLPFLTAHFVVPKVKAPRVPALERPTRLGPVTVPSPSKTVYYFGLGALAVTEVVEWPIAAAIAAGTYVAQHTRGDRSAAPHLERSGEQDQESERADPAATPA